MCNRFRVILNILIVLHVRISYSAESKVDVLRIPRSFEKHSRGIMSPKMDYDEWTPLGRGDPLKNDPTFDYSPPMVSKVKYWINPLLRTPDPPIVPMKEFTTETSDFTEMITSPSKPMSPKQSTDIRRFYIDFKEPSDMSYVQLMNSKYNNKFVRPQQQQVQYQNHYYNPTRPPPPPLPMLVPPPPIEPNRYVISSKKDNVWNSTKTSLPASVATTISFISPTTTPTSFMKTPPLTMKTDKPFLKILLNKETSESNQVTTNPTTLKPLTPNPTPYMNKYSHPVRPPPYLIIQGHSKVKKYGIGNVDRADNPATQDTNDIVSEPAKYELPKDIREGKHLGTEDFLPLNGIDLDRVRDIVSNQVEGSGFGSEVNNRVFPTYVKPTTMYPYEPPRRYNDENEEYSYV